MSYPRRTKLIQTFAKDPALKDADWLVVSECLGNVWPEVLAEAAKGRVVLSVCPEGESAGVVYGKLASMIRSCRPRSIAVLTTECSPHCYTLQAAVNEAIYIAEAHDIPVSLAVCCEGKVKAISPAAVRVARYLHLVEELVGKHPEVLERLDRLSLEHRAAGAKPAARPVERRPTAPD